ncbi:2TM domain-containing protein [Pseudoalteromonas mariniglutinosa]|uniref:2TM domain-containing protein n=1 Tax=Pseudoalteromonas mariniglutinosa TaxID=206042 RepID=UPI003850F458
MSFLTPCTMKVMKTYLVGLVFLLVVNVLTSPGNLWVVWPTLGMAIAILFQVICKPTQHNE